MHLILIAAVARNGAIGKDNALLWRLADDLQRFKQLTMGCPVLMGRKTFDSIGRALPGRRNIVITRNPQWSAPQVQTAHSLDQALELVAQEPRVFMIGGAELYAQSLPRADELLLTEVDADFAADAFFPPWERSDFTEVTRETRQSVQGWAYHFVRYQRNTTSPA